MIIQYKTDLVYNSITCVLHRGVSVQTYSSYFAGNDAPWNGTQYRQIEEKSYQRLGASIYSAGNDGQFVVRHFSDVRNLRYMYVTRSIFTCRVEHGTGGGNRTMLS